MLFLKKISAIILICIMMIQSLMVIVICLDYSLNKKFITDNFCVNKNKPQLHCNGKCYLSKNLKQAQEKDENGYGYSYSFSCFVFLKPEITASHFVFYLNKEKITPHSQSLHTSIYSNDVFHPPGC